MLPYCTDTSCIYLNMFYRNLVLCGSMDRQAFIIDLDQTDDLLLQKFENHTKYVSSYNYTVSECVHSYVQYIRVFRYVVRVLWSTSGTYFVTASYDKTVCVYR